MVPNIFFWNFFLISFMVPIMNRMSIFYRKSSSDRTCSINIRFKGRVLSGKCFQPIIWHNFMVLKYIWWNPHISTETGNDPKWPDRIGQNFWNDSYDSYRWLTLRLFSAPMRSCEDAAVWAKLLNLKMLLKFIEFLYN